LVFLILKGEQYMLVQLPEEQTQEIQKMIATLIKDEIHHFKEDMGLDTPFLNKKQTCHYLGVSHNTLDIWIAMGLPYIRIGKSIRFSKESINQWMTRLEISA